MAAQSLFAIGNFDIEHFEPMSEGRPGTKEEPFDLPEPNTKEKNTFYPF